MSGLCDCEWSVNEEPTAPSWQEGARGWMWKVGFQIHNCRRWCMRPKLGEGITLSLLDVVQASFMQIAWSSEVSHVDGGPMGDPRPTLDQDRASLFP